MFHHAPQYSELTLTHIRDSATHSGDMPKFGFPFVTECVWPTRTKLEGEDHAGSFPIAWNLSQGNIMQFKLQQYTLLRYSPLSILPEFALTLLHVAFEPVYLLCSRSQGGRLLTWNGLCCFQASDLLPELSDRAWGACDLRHCRLRLRLRCCCGTTGSGGGGCGRGRSPSS